MSRYALHIRLKNNLIKTFELASIIRCADRHMTLVGALEVARTLIDGGVWSPHRLTVDTFFLQDDLFSVVDELAEVQKEALRKHEEDQRRYDESLQLLAAGAEGDAAAAIEFCRRAQTGEFPMNQPCMG